MIVAAWLRACVDAAFDRVARMRFRIDDSDGRSAVDIPVAPEWWPEFEHEFRAYAATATERRP
jgi:hypothetical protein